MEKEEWHRRAAALEEARDAIIEKVAILEGLPIEVVREGFVSLGNSAGHLEFYLAMRTWCSKKGQSPLEHSNEPFSEEWLLGDEPI